jgi:SHS2 domain-containing protein
MYKLFKDSIQKSFNIECDNLETLFKNIAFSFKEFVLGNTKTDSKSLRNVYLIENSLEELVIQWIGELNRQIIYHDWIFDNFKELKISLDNNLFTLYSDLTGEGINSNKHKILYNTTYLNIKNLEIENFENKYKVKFNLKV